MAEVTPLLDEEIMPADSIPAHVHRLILTGFVHRVRRRGVGAYASCENACAERRTR
jgi:hypothetical protein